MFQDVTEHNYIEWKIRLLREIYRKVQRLEGHYQMRDAMVKAELQRVQQLATRTYMQVDRLNNRLKDESSRRAEQNLLLENGMHKSILAESTKIRDQYLALVTDLGRRMTALELSAGQEAVQKPGSDEPCASAAPGPSAGCSTQTNVQVVNCNTVRAPVTQNLANKSTAAPAFRTWQQFLEDTKGQYEGADQPSTSAAATAEAEGKMGDDSSDDEGAGIVVDSMEELRMVDTFRSMILLGYSPGMALEEKGLPPVHHVCTLMCRPNVDSECTVGTQPWAKRMTLAYDDTSDRARNWSKKLLDQYIDVQDEYKRLDPFTINYLIATGSAVYRNTGQGRRLMVDYRYLVAGNPFKE